MARKIIVVTAAYGHDCIKELGGQSAVLPFIAGSGADGVEIRRELFSADELKQLPALAATIERHNLLACYSAPEALFEANGALNPRLPALLREAQTLNALWLKLSLGHFTRATAFGGPEITAVTVGGQEPEHIDRIARFLRHYPFPI